MKNENGSKEKFSFLNFSKLTPLELRVIGISLSILSLGIAIAWAGFLYFSSK